MTDVIRTEDDKPTDPNPPGGGTTVDPNGSHEGNGAGGGITASPMGSHEGNKAPTGKTT